MDIAALTARWRQRLRAETRVGYHASDVWVVEDAGRVAGFAQIGPCGGDRSLAGFAGEVYMLYVHPGQTGRGLGRALLGHSLDILAGRGYYWAVIWVLQKNDGARAFYQRAGLRPDGTTRREHFAGRRVPVMRYAKAINQVLDFEALRRGHVRQR
jgi:GNAT superfamily N-acetyltransferase